MTFSHTINRGVSPIQDAVKRYILEQQHKPNVFEYSIFGDSKGTSKIGDFTQSKLERWSK